MIGAAALAVTALPAMALDGLALEAGQSPRTDMVRMAGQWQWSQRWFQGADWHVGGFWDVSAARWRRDALPGQRSHLTEIGLTPVFRLQGNDRSGPYLEGGIGVHLFSATGLGNKRFGTAVQFGDHLGLGYRIGAADIGLRYQHLSNGGIASPNHGIDIYQVRLQYWFR